MRGWGITPAASSLTSVRLLCHDRQAYCRAMPTRSSILACRSTISEFKACSGSDRGVPFQLVVLRSQAVHREFKVEVCRPVRGEEPDSGNLFDESSEDEEDHRR